MYPIPQNDFFWFTTWYNLILKTVLWGDYYHSSFVGAETEESICFRWVHQLKDVWLSSNAFLKQGPVSLGFFQSYF